MAKRVYDPIHDTYQIQATPEPPVLSHPQPNTQDEPEGNSFSTQSEASQSAGNSMADSSNDEGKDEGKESTVSADSPLSAAQTDSQQSVIPPPPAMELVQYPGNERKSKHSHAMSFMTTTLRPKPKAKEPSRYTRHLKKSDGEPFTRRDIQYEFLSKLLSDKRQVFTNPFKDFFPLEYTPEEGKVVNVTDVDYNARNFIKSENLTFSQIYILTIASSSKCSKVLRDKLLFDHHVAFSTCILSLLVNMGRLNTTVNFFLEMTSQLRTFHSIPCLQHYSSDPKSLQDTPRIKSILKTIPLGSDTPIEFHKWYAADYPRNAREWVNPVSLIFAFCEQHAILDWNIIIPNCEPKISLYQLFDENDYSPQLRVNLFLWLMYIHMETNLTPEALQSSKPLFGVEENGMFILSTSSVKHDVDTPVEVEYGDEQLEKRISFLNQTGAERTIVQQTMETPPTGPDGESVDSETSVPDVVPAAPTSKSKQSRGSSKEKTSKQQPTIIQQDTQRKKRQSNAASSKNNTEDNSNNAESKAALKTKIQQAKDERVQQKIDLDKSFKITDDLTQDQLRTKLIEAHKITNKKNHELGLIKLFDEFEDVPLATIVGIRGKKRKKFSDGILGYETDMLGVLRHSKRTMLKRLKEKRGVPDPAPEADVSLQENAAQSQPTSNSTDQVEKFEPNGTASNVETSEVETNGTSEVKPNITTP
ncbi:unnamed protein product [Kluyveromyces dobzhanskii CBS 2104]|uniref:WGS project CCBQ000000000 data, contig 00104 n=1 Tax=Kluyveromyces dobzhanskii CBS 2104 TaxID=1427455 RepID=A0A0A8L3I4_9SACH|nr:unnamed protein product [Kluyveromyces dobzhanskii CBS 2104]